MFILDTWLAKQKAKKIERLRLDATQKMYQADLAGKGDRAMLHLACEAVLQGLRNNVQFNPTDPVFRRFHERRWAREMERVCQEMKHPMTKVGHVAAWAVLTSAGAFIGGARGVVVGLGCSFVSSFVFEKIKAVPRVYNQDLWDNFYEQISKRPRAKELSKEQREIMTQKLEKVRDEYRRRCALRHRPVTNMVNIYFLKRAAEKKRRLAG
ncbi:MAG: hypothetical protein II942_00255 [Alphaproteobacteria bacterium]|nr:hypothetical protein [Alphaproteobacteria bacterium]